MILFCSGQLSSCTVLNVPTEMFTAWSGSSMLTDNCLCFNPSVACICKLSLPQWLNEAKVWSRTTAFQFPITLQADHMPYCVSADHMPYCASRCSEFTWLPNKFEFDKSWPYNYVTRTRFSCLHQLPSVNKEQQVQLPACKCKHWMFWTSDHLLANKQHMQAWNGAAVLHSNCAPSQQQLTWQPCLRYG